MKPYVLALSLAVIVTGFSIQNCLADDTEDSLDSIWAEESTPNKPQNSQSQTTGDLIPQAKASTTKVNNFAPVATKALSNLEDVMASHFVKQGGWPGIGPFRPANSEGTFADAKGNRLNFRVVDGQVAEASFILNDKGAGSEDFLDLQVGSDFLLESLSIKPKHIVEFNKHLEESKESLLDENNSEIKTIDAGRYMVRVQKKAAESGQNRYNFLVQVTSKEASPQILKEHSITAEKEINQKIGLLPLSTNKKVEPVNQIKPPAKEDNLALAFSKTVENWQDLKRTAVRQRKTEDLSQVLAGKALIRQTDAIKWLLSNKKYYEMTPKSITVEKYNEIGPNKYAVFVEIKEISKLMDDATNQVVKEQDDSYKVNYTLEKTNNKWFITDSAIVDKTTTPPANQRPTKPR